MEVEAEEVEEVVGTKCQSSYPATSAVNGGRTTKNTTIKLKLGERGGACAIDDEM